MFEIKERKVNRKQLHYLLSKFLLKKGLAQKFYYASMKYKLGNNIYTSMFKKYNFSMKETFSEHLYKCIDIYCDEKNFSDREYIKVYFHDEISGFFSLIPSTFEDGYFDIWGKVSDEWEKITKGIKLDYGYN